MAPSQPRDAVARGLRNACARADHTSLDATGRLRRRRLPLRLRTVPCPRALERRAHRRATDRQVHKRDSALCVRRPLNASRRAGIAACARLLGDRRIPPRHRSPALTPDRSRAWATNGTVGDHLAPAGGDGRAGNHPDWCKMIRGALIALALSVVVVAGFRAFWSQEPRDATTGANAERGRTALVEFGCGTCHTVPGVTAANGRVGPSLADFSTHTYVAGRLPNNRD